MNVSKEPNPIDRHVGNRVRMQRILLNMSQEKLGEALGITFQQVQKYESGHNRVSASRLFDISRVLNCPIAYFFEDIGPETTGVRTTPAARSAEDLAEEVADIDADPIAHFVPAPLPDAWPSAL